MSLNASFFRYWADENTDVAVDPDPPAAAVARPWVVRLSGKCHVPINAIVFAETALAARDRVWKALNECAEKEYKSADRISEPRAASVLQDFHDGKLIFEVEPYDIAVISSVQWACNGGL